MRCKWKVQDKPTGRYASFQRRGWPDAYDKITGRILFSVSCEDDYTNGKPPHPPLKLSVAVANETGSFDWKKLKLEFANMKELKTRAEEILILKPEWFI